MFDWLPSDTQGSGAYQPGAEPSSLQSAPPLANRYQYVAQSAANQRALLTQLAAEITALARSGDLPNMVSQVDQIVAIFTVAVREVGRQVDLLTSYRSEYAAAVKSLKDMHARAMAVARSNAPIADREQALQVAQSVTQALSQLAGLLNTAVAGVNVAYDAAESCQRAAMDLAARMRDLNAGVVAEKLNGVVKSLKELEDKMGSGGFLDKIGAGIGVAIAAVGVALAIAMARK